MLNLRWSWHAEPARPFRGHRPGGLGAGRRRPGRPARPRCRPSGWPQLAARPEFLRRLERRRRRPARLPDRAALVPGPVGQLADAPGGDRLLLARVRHHRGAAAVLRRPRHPGRRPPEGRQRPRRAADRRRPALPARLLHPVAVAPRAGRRSATRPATPTACRSRLLRDAAGDPVAGQRRAGRAARRWPPRSGSPRSGRVPLLLLDTDVEENDAAAREVTDRLYGGGSEHRLRQELLLGIGGVRAVRAYCAVTGHPEPEVFHTNEGHAGLPRARADPGADRRARPALRRGAGAVPGRHRVHHAHARARRASTGSRVELIERHFGGQAAEPGVPVDQILALGAETYPGGDPDRVQHGRDGHAAGPAGQRRQQAARRRSAGRCSPACGRASTPTRCRSARSPTACTRRPGSRPRSSSLARTAASPGRGDGSPTTRRPGTPWRPIRPDLRDQAAAAGAAGRAGPAAAARLLAAARRLDAELGWIDQRARRERADHRLRPPGAILQAADADAARPGAADASCCSTPSGRCRS